MSDITPIGAAGLAPLERVQRPSDSSLVSTTTTRDPDRADLSLQARLLSRLSELPDVRTELVDRVRAEIDAGTYDSDDKIDALLDDLAEDLR